MNIVVLPKKNAQYKKQKISLLILLNIIITYHKEKL